VYVAFVHREEHHQKSAFREIAAEMREVEVGVLDATTVTLVSDWKDAVDLAVGAWRRFRFFCFQACVG
jgi:hypothetical protein